MIQTRRLILNDFNLSDTKLLNSIRNDRDVQTYLPKKGSESCEKTRSLIKALIEANANQSGLNFAIRLPDHTLIGFVGMWTVHPEEHWGEVGFLLNKQHWNQGYTKEALGAFMPLILKRKDCQEIRAVVHRENVYSKRLLTTNGFEFACKADNLPDFERFIFQIQKVPC